MESISNKQAGTRDKLPPDTRRAFTVTGSRVTNQRALVLEIIRQGEGHLDADEVYRRARQRSSRLSLSTVYRTLQLFKKLGLVEELHFDETHHHYEVKPLSEHHHLVCLGCGRVIEFRYPLARHVKRNVPEAKDFEIVDAEIRMTGYCPECRQDRK
jgi:Fur family ferric uptake transcriptional regulator